MKPTLSPKMLSPGSVVADHQRHNC